MSTSKSTEQTRSRKNTAAFYAALEAALGHPIPRGWQDAEPAAEASPRAALAFTIVIPALNEEQAIAGTLQDVLQACPQIMAETPVDNVQVVVVNDGSTDRTQEIAQGFGDVRVIRFPRNRGYGAAIKAGFKVNDSALVGFMDADGTLQGKSWVPLINTLLEQHADVVLGARLNAESEMPAVRRLGNWFFARLIGFISERPLTDCASGMRVIKRASLRYLMPLPDGLHFTPAMSCNAVMDHRLKISEVPVPYAERVGRSKLSVLRDGMRFLTTILLTGCFYNPLKCAATGVLLSWLGAALAWLAGWDPSLLVKTLIGVDVMALVAAVVCHQAVRALIVADAPAGGAERLLHHCTQPRWLVHLGLGALGISALSTLAVLLGPPQVMASLGSASLVFCFMGVVFILLGISLRMMQLIRFKFDALINDPFTKRQART